MPSPFDNPFQNPFGNPFDLQSQGGRPQQTMFPALPPEEAESALMKYVGRPALSGLGFLGTVLGTPGSVVSGLLAGEPGRAFGGIFDPQQRVGGREMLEKWGALAPNQEGFDAGDVAGFAADVLTDPLVWVNPFGALTKGAGAAGAKIGATRGMSLAKGIRGVSELTEQQAKRAAQLGIPAEDVLNQPLMGAVEVGLPWPLSKLAPDARAVLGTGPAAQKYAEGLGKAKEFLGNAPWVPGLPKVHHLGALFDYAVGGQTYRPGQTAMKEVVTPGREAAGEAGRELRIGQQRMMEKAAEHGLDLPTVNRIMSAVIEKPADPFKGIEDLAGRTAERRFAEPLAQQYKQEYHQQLWEARAKGQNAKEFMSPIEKTPEGVPLEYGPHQIHPAIVQDVRAARGLERSEFDQAAGHTIKRKSPWNNLSYEIQNRLAADKRIAGATPEVTKVLDRVEIIAKEYLNVPGPTIRTVTPTGVVPRSRIYDPAGELMGEVASVRGTQAKVRTFTRAEGEEIIEETAIRGGGRETITGRPHTPGLVETERYFPVAALEALQSSGYRIENAPVQQIAEEAAKHPFFKQAVKLEKRLRKMPAQVVDGQVPFLASPAEAHAWRKESHLRQMANIDGTVDMIKNTAVPEPRPGYVPLYTKKGQGESALKTLRMNWHGKHPDTGEKVGGLFHIAKEMGITPQEAAKLYVPKEMVDAASKFVVPFAEPSAIKPVLKFYDQVLNGFKGGVAGMIIFPARYVRDRMQGMFTNWMMSSHNNPARLIKLEGVANRIADGAADPAVAKLLDDLPIFKTDPALVGMTPDQKLKQVSDWAEIYQAGPGVRNRQSADIIDVPGQAGATFTQPQRPGLPGEPGWVPKGVLQVNPPRADLGQLVPKSRQDLNPLLMRGVVGDENKFWLAKAGDNQLTRNDFVLRMTHALDKMMDGFHPAEAFASARKAHLDYSALSDFERSVMRRTMPFYSFSRKNLSLQMELMLNQPGKMATAIRAATAARSQGYVPNYIGEGTAIPLPGAPEGEQRFVSQFGLGFEDEAIRALGSAASGKPGRAIEQLAGMTSPMLKYPLELMTGRQFFTGRQLKDLRPAESVRAGAGLVGLEDVASPVSQVLANTPAARLVSTIDRLMDVKGLRERGRKDPLAVALNLLTGIKITDADTHKAQQIEGRKLLEDMQKDSGKAKVFQRLYVPPDLLPTLTPEDTEKMRLLSYLTKQAEHAALVKRAEAGDLKAKQKLQKEAKR